MTLFRAFVISGFRREAYENCTLLDYYAANSAYYFEGIHSSCWCACPYSVLKA